MFKNYMRVALVHDYIKEFGGAERVLETMCEIFPDAPIYTAFYDKKGTAFEHFKHKKIIPSWAHYVPFFVSKLHSPLRFLAPLIWGSFDFSNYDLVISSASWYVTKGFGSHGPTSPRLRGTIGKPIEICYCHTPPRWLYGYATSVNFQKYPLVKAYAAIVGHLMRLYDFKAAQKVDYFIANSQEVAGRIKKFYRRDSTVIYPPVELASSKLASSVQFRDRELNASKLDARRSYYLIISRLTGAKGLELAVDAALKMGFKLKIAGSSSGYYSGYNKLVKRSQGKARPPATLPKELNMKQAGIAGEVGRVEFLGQVTDEKLAKLYQGAKAFLALSKDEDFGITPVEAMSVGIPVIAFNSGGYKETILQGKTGLLFDDYSVDGLISAIKQFESASRRITIDPKDCIAQAQKFGKERFKKEIKEFVSSHCGLKSPAV